MPGNAPLPTPIAHLTSVENLASIASCNALYCNRRMGAEGIGHADISNAEIQAARASTRVPCGPGGALHEYVPFFFNPLSPMLFRTVRDYYQPKDRRQFAHVISTAQQVAEAGLGYVFTNGHATMILTDYFADLSDLGQVDWEIMHATYWNDTEQDGDRQRRRQAEFLVRDEFPLELATEICVADQAVRDSLAFDLSARGCRLPVVVRRDYFY